MAYYSCMDGLHVVFPYFQAGYSGFEATGMIEWEQNMFRAELKRWGRTFYVKVVPFRASNLQRNTMFFFLLISRIKSFNRNLTIGLCQRFANGYSFLYKVPFSTSFSSLRRPHRILLKRDIYFQPGF